MLDGDVAAAESVKTAGPLAEEGVLGNPRGVVDVAMSEPSSPPAAPTTFLSKEGCRRCSRASKKVTRRDNRCVLFHLLFPIKNKTKSSLSTYNTSRTKPQRVHSVT